MSDQLPESFFAIRRTDGFPIACAGDMHWWIGCDGSSDWTPAEEADHGGDPVEYEIVRMTVDPVARRIFGTHPEEEQE